MGSQKKKSKSCRLAHRVPRLDAKPIQKKTLSSIGPSASLLSKPFPPSGVSLTHERETETPPIPQLCHPFLARNHRDGLEV